jgi:hypothetical protein
VTTIDDVFEELKDGTEDFFPEGSSRTITTTLTDSDANAIAASDLTGDGYLRLTLWEKYTGDILNSRNAQSILNLNGGAITAQGVLTLKLSPSDMAINTDANKTEIHRGIIEVKINSGDKDEEKICFEMKIRNLSKIT